MPNLSRKKHTRVRTAALALGVSALAFGVAFADPVRLLETGSSLLYPMFNVWVAHYSKSHPNVQITTQSTGSGTGISQAIQGVVQIGASDAYLSDPQIAQNPGMLNIPLAVSSQTVDYNIPGLTAAQRLTLSGPVLAGIYSGSIRYWNDPAIARLNPGIPLPHHAIVPIHRADGSGDTFIFTQFLAFSTPSWSNSLHYGTTVNWPQVPGAIGSNGNPGMVSSAKSVPYSVAYIGISYRAQSGQAGLHEAKLVNRDGRAVLDSPATVAAAVTAMASKTPPDERLSLVFAPGANSYPIVNYEYAIVKQQQASPQVANELKAFLKWATSPTGGNTPAMLAAASFQGLPAAVRAMSEKQIDTIH